MTREELQKEMVKAQISATIAELENQLASEDYKVIKCAEAKLMDKEMPYDVAELTEKRDAIRAQINALQAQS